MLEAFVLGLWIIWSGSREVYPLSESLWFVMIAVMLRQLSVFQIPVIDMPWAVSNGILWLFAACAFFAVRRMNRHSSATLPLAALVSFAYFHLAQSLPL